MGLACCKHAAWAAAFSRLGFPEVGAHLAPWYVVAVQNSHCSQALSGLGGPWNAFGFARPSPGKRRHHEGC